MSNFKKINFRLNSLEKMDVSTDSQIQIIYNYQQEGNVKDSVDNESVGERECQNEIRNDILQAPIPCEQVSTTPHANLEDQTVAEQDRLVRNCSSLIPVRRSQRERHMPRKFGYNNMFKANTAVVTTLTDVPESYQDIFNRNYTLGIKRL